MCVGVCRGQCGAQAPEADGVVRPLAGQEPAGVIVHPRVERREVQADACIDGRHPQRRQGGVLTTQGAVEGHPGSRVARGPRRGALEVAIGVGVVVEAQVEPGRAPEVEQAQRLTRLELRHRAQRGQQGGAPSDLVGLGDAGAHHVAQRVTVLLAEAAEGRDHVATGTTRRPTTHGGHGVVPVGERVVGTGQEEVVHGGQQQDRPPLGGRGPVEQCQHLGILGHPAADGGVRGPPVALDRGRQGPEVVGQGEVDDHRLRSWPARAGSRRRRRTTTGPVRPRSRRRRPTSG